MTTRRRIHILYEYGPDLMPHGSAYIRLLRPFRHPALGGELEVSADRTYEGQGVDAVIVDRLWRPDISAARAEDLVEAVHHAGARLIYALDDNFLTLASERKDWRPTYEHAWVMRFFLQHADGVMVTTQTLKRQLSSLNSNIVVVPHALDERLLIGGGMPQADSPFGRRRKVVGYMGTLTHDDDLMSILPALQVVCKRHRDEIELQITGVVGHATTREALTGLPVRLVNPRPDEIDYPLFMLWFTSRLNWDIAIAPLRDTPFTQCKSDIKFLDYSALGAAGIYSRMPAYESSVRHGETGWLVGNEVSAWVEALEELVVEEHLRVSIARQASNELYARRILKHRARDWLIALESLLNGQ